MFNKAQVKEIFEKHAILIGENDVIPFCIARNFISEKAMELAEEYGSGGGKYQNTFCTNGNHLEYFTLRGFQIAATYQNIEELNAKTS